MADNEEIIKVIQTFFEAGRTKNFSALRNIQLDSKEFSAFNPRFSKAKMQQNEIYGSDKNYNTNPDFECKRNELICESRK